MLTEEEKNEKIFEKPKIHLLSNEEERKKEYEKYLQILVNQLKEVEAEKKKKSSKHSKKKLIGIRVKN